MQWLHAIHPFLMHWHQGKMAEYCYKTLSLLIVRCGQGWRDKTEDKIVVWVSGVPPVFCPSRAWQRGEAPHYLMAQSDYDSGRPLAGGQTWRTVDWDTFLHLPPTLSQRVTSRWWWKQTECILPNCLSKEKCSSGLPSPHCVRKYVFMLASLWRFVVISCNELEMQLRLWLKPASPFSIHPTF